MAKGWIVFLSLILAGCAPPFQNSFRREPPNCAWRVCLRAIETPAGRVYLATNGEPVAATVVLSFDSLINLETEVSLPVERVVPPDSSVALVEMRRIRPDGPLIAEASVAIDLGSSKTEADTSYLYAVPFGGTAPRELSQGFDGSESHLGGMRYSLDFAMPEGTPILASRPGIVLYVQDGFSEGGPDPDLLERANMVVIAHRDGSMASYGHLARGIAVSQGQRVSEGELLGHSGSSGFAGRPHLHFHIGLRLLRDPGRTIPLKLKGPDGDTLDLAVGTMIPPAPVLSR